MAKKKRRKGAGRQPAPPARPTEQPQLSAEERALRRAEQKREWAQQKRVQERAAGRSFAPIISAVAVVVVLAVAIPVMILLAGGGGDDDGAAATPFATVDPRLGGVTTPAQTFTVTALDDGVAINPRFSPTQVTARAGEVFEIVMPNEGTSVHNVRVDGLDHEYDTNDDWTTTTPNNPG
jgi:hypothetical protein